MSFRTVDFLRLTMSQVNDSEYFPGLRFYISEAYSLHVVDIISKYNLTTESFPTYECFSKNALTGTDFRTKRNLV